MPKYKKLSLVGVVLFVVPILIIATSEYVLNCEGDFVAYNHILSFVFDLTHRMFGYMIYVVIIGLLVFLSFRFLWKRSMNIPVTEIGLETIIIFCVVSFILSTLVASLNTTRSKGPDSSSYSSLNNLRAQAELYFDRHAQSYEGFCDDQNTLNRLEYVRSDLPQVGLLCKKHSQREVGCYDTKDAYAVSTALLTKLSRGKYFCIDSTGFAGVTETPATGTECPK